jgi:methylenetetrahydrofolate reductase (NADPH)
VLQKRAMDVTKLLLPYEPTDFLTELAAHKAANPGFGIEQVHFFPLGGIKTNATWVTETAALGRPPRRLRKGSHDPYRHRIENENRHHRL